VAQDLVREAGMEMRDIRAIGSHGQSVWHEPWGENPVTLQLGKGDLIASNTGTTVLVDFRSADVKAGGQGTPLAPLLHQRLFYCETEDRAILNLGGIASLTILPSNGGVTGFDCGPGLCLLDAWTKRHLQKDHDSNGDWAAKGQISSNMVNRMLQDPYFEEAPPRNTQLEYFDMSWLESFVAGSGLNEVDVQASLVELTTLSVARRLHDSGLPKRLLICGGGVQNTFLIDRIAAALPGVIVDSTTRYGADPEWLEGLLFAWLAQERLHGKVQHTPPITGASHPVLLGEIFEP
jgi:anhydro-N-acetylmuramic acid kinase